MHKGYFKIMHTKKPKKNVCSTAQAQYFTVTLLKPNEVPRGWPFMYFMYKWSEESTRHSNFTTNYGCGIANVGLKSIM